MNTEHRTDDYVSVICIYKNLIMLIMVTIIMVFEIAKSFSASDTTSQEQFSEKE